jgi:hypothetical protein
MQIAPLASLLLLSLALPATVFAQGKLSAEEILADAERAYPESRIPVLFGPGSDSAAFAAEVDDPSWSGDMEERIYAEIANEQARGLVLRRSDVQCRATTCAMLLVHVADRGEGSVGHLVDTIRQQFGFAGLSQSSKEIPLQFSEETESGVVVRTWFLNGYVEVLLMAGRGTQRPVL